MLLRTAIPALILFGGLFAIPASVRAAESYDNCTGFITSLPATISTQGTWCMNQDLSTAMSTGEAITIATNNVTIDCNDFKLGGLAAGVGTGTFGIYAGNRLNATVRHCNIRGFREGVRFDGFAGGGGHVVEDNRLDGNTYAGLNIWGDGSVVRRNLVRDTGNSSISTGDAFGIVTLFAVDVLDNTISGVLPSSNGGNGTAYGIWTSLNLNGSIHGNRVRGLVRLGMGVTYGIYNDIYNDSLARISVGHNHVIGDGSAGSIGLRCDDSNGRAINNIVNGFAIPIENCRNDGNSL